MIEPRGWQEEALNEFKKNDRRFFLVEGTPGCGKTIFSGLCARYELEGNSNFVVVVVPTTALKGDSKAGFLGDWHTTGLEITTVLRAGHPPPKEFCGGVITYQQLDSMVATFDTWANNGHRIMFVFDEVHHLTEENRWGSAAESCARIASRILSMTGTPFRGDKRRISFVRYDKDNEVISDAKYTYRQAVAQKICREVMFAHDDGVAEYILHDEEFKKRISETELNDEGSVSRVIFNKNSKWLERVLQKADLKLDEYRLSDSDAGGIVICMPGADDNDERHLYAVAALLERTTGEKPEVVTYDDPEANAKIERFRSSKSSRWICAVKKVSEGVDIKRLRVMVLATRPTTELLFRQMVGRVVRTDCCKESSSCGHARQDSTVYMAGFPLLKEFASRIEEEAKSGIKDREEPVINEITGDGEGGENKRWLHIIGSTHEDGGATSNFGETFTAGEIIQAEVLKRNDPELMHVSITVVAHILKKVGRIETDFSDIPMHEKKKNLRKELVKLAQQAAYKTNSDKPPFSLVWRAVCRKFGTKNIDDLMDNHPIEKMEAVKEYIKLMLVDGVPDAA